MFQAQRAVKSALHEAQAEGGLVLRCTGQAYDRFMRPVGSMCTAVLVPFLHETPKETVNRARAKGWAILTDSRTGQVKSAMCPSCRAPEGRPVPAMARSR